MNLKAKVAIGLIDTAIILLLFLSLYIVFTPPGLHYLLIPYSAFGILVLNSVRLLIILNNQKSVAHFLPYITTLLVVIGALVAPEHYLLMQVLIALNCLILLFIAYDFWQPNNIGRTVGSKVIGFFKVDLKAKGWVEKKNKK